VRAKKPQKPRRSLRYLIYADRALQRLSLKRISVRPKKATKASRTVRTKTAARETSLSRKVAAAVPVKRASRSLQRTDPWWMGFAAVCAVGIVVLIGVPSSSQRPDRASARVEADASEPQPDTELVPLDTLKPASKAPAMTAPARTRTVKVASANSNAPVPAKQPAIEPTESAHPPAGANGQNAAFVTIHGCLQPGNDTFWLKDTSGADAPKSRSWRSGFLKKRSAPVEIVDAAGALNLSKYVGQRVVASGSVSDRRMQAYSLQRVAASCN
jgi:hypothetical protein